MVAASKAAYLQLGKGMEVQFGRWLSRGRLVQGRKWEWPFWSFFLKKRARLSWTCMTAGCASVLNGPHVCLTFSFVQFGKGNRTGTSFAFCQTGLKYWNKIGLVDLIHCPLLFSPPRVIAVIKKEFSVTTKTITINLFHFLFYLWTMPGLDWYI